MANVRLITDPKTVGSGLASDLVAELTYPSIFRECPALVYPALILSADDAATYVVNHPDSDPFIKRMPSDSFVTYGKYFEWNADGGTGRTFADTVRSSAGTAILEVQPDIVLSRFDALAATGPISVASPRDAAPVFVYRKLKQEIEAQWEATRTADGVLVSPFVSTLRQGERLIAAAAAPAIGFEPLDELLHESKLNGLLITSPHNVELFTGLSYEFIAQQAISCLYRPGHADILVMSEAPIMRTDFLLQEENDDSIDIVRDAIPAGSLGVEEPHIGIGLVDGIRRAGLTVSGAVSLLRQWQEKRAVTDIGYFILAGNAVLKGFERAKSWFAQQESCSERDLEAIFQQGVADFAADFGFEGRVRPYFSIVHSGERTLLPATAGEYRVHSANDTVKFDMGVLVYDAFGCVRACSDIARTICRTPELQAAHDALRSTLVDRLIPSMRAGMSGGEVHALGVEVLRSCEGELVAAGMMPQGVTFEGYLRDCGHILHRTTTATIFFLPGVSRRLETGMLGCVEFVWPLGQCVLAVEDGYLVTDTDVICFTA